MDLSKLFENFIEKDKNYKIAYDLVKQNSDGKIWLIGGALSRNLNQLVHGVPQLSFDFDFVVEKPHEIIRLPFGWMIKKNSFGNPKFINKNFSIDFVPINNIKHLIEENLEPTIENVLKSAPFTIQALAYDTQTKKIIDKGGFDALQNKIFKINNIKTATYLADIKMMKLNDIILKKSKSMNFEPELILQKI
jgi:tRNA nucleotidyltransferase/poly(A) polymerase